MSKTNSEILASFKKANKQARERMATRAGFKSADDFRLHLEGKPTTKKVGVNKKSTGKPTIHIVSILDASTSMNWGSNKIGAAVSGINSEIQELKGDNEVNYIYTLVKFSYADSIRTLASRVPLNEMNTVVAQADGNTALYDAIGLTLTKVKETTKEGEKVLVKIFTDGEENASTKYNAAKVEKLIEECKTLGFTVTFVGTDRDIKEVVKRLAVDASNTLVHDNTARGVQMSFMASTNATKSYSKKVLNKEDVLTGFYKSNETL